MSKRVVTIPRTSGQDSLDLVSHGRAGPSGSIRLSDEQIAQVARTVRKTPEVVVKVSGGARDTAGAKAHFDYIDRHGKLALETDDGRSLTGRDAGAELIADWNLDLSRGQYRPKPPEGEKDKRPKLVHNIVLSMPGKTPPDVVLEAARRFARENFALQYRYAMVLHTDQAHPHVHLVVKAEHEVEPGQRLHIRKATLRQWREQFAEHLRELGVAANATPAPLRGLTRSSKKDPIHQRMKSVSEFHRLAGDIKDDSKRPVASTFMRAKVEAVAEELRQGYLSPEPGKASLIRTRQMVASQWMNTAAALRAQGEEQLASEVEAFARSMPAVRTEREQIAAGLLAQIHASRQRSQPLDTPDQSVNRGA